jgi:hypothetical protein
MSGDLIGAEALLQQAADLGDTIAMRDLAMRRLRAGDSTGAVAFLQQAVDRGDPIAFWELTELLARTGDTAGADRMRRFGLTGSGEIATTLEFKTRS